MSSVVSLLPSVQAHCAGAVILPEKRTLVIADVHLGFSWAQRRRGQLGPLADEKTRGKLLSLVQEVAPECIVFLGDLVHAPRPCWEERLWIEKLLLDLSEKAELVCVRGNHDRGLPGDFAELPLRLVDLWTAGNLVAKHGDVLPEIGDDAQTLLLGHIHPALPIYDAAGAGRKLPAFLATERCVLLPAFSPFAGGFNLFAGTLPERLLRLFGTGPIRAFAATGNRIMALGEFDRLLERMFAQERGRPGEFRRRTPRSQSTSSGR